MANIISISTRNIYQLKIELLGSEPVIWRRFQVYEDCTLHKLHSIIQIAMGWENCHLYEFIVGGLSYGEPHPDYEGRVKSSKSVKLSQVADREKAKFTYIYDFGDGWQHEAIVEKLLPADPKVSYPFCIDGKMACPPEDCGGIGGYAYFLEAIGNRKHKEHKDMLGWIGGEFDPTKFDIQSVNKRLKLIR
ncbi:MAG: plasmid pRiA4b ORF-3 family protein [Bacteroidota bacterium]|nr:plasmid pRiA4b ORF-3 family protein [Bacteroidota bacterium]